MKLSTFPRRSPTVTVIVGLVLISASAVSCSSGEEDATSSQAAAATPETVYISAEFVNWVSNTEGIVKNADDVFVGTVVSAGETFSLYGEEHGDVWTPYTVQVEQRLLGSVDGTIIVVQQGGFDADRNILVIVEEDPLLQVGETYMLASLSNRQADQPEWNGLHFVAAVKGHIRIEDEAHRQQLIQEYTDAITRTGRGS